MRILSQRGSLAGFLRVFPRILKARRHPNIKAICPRSYFINKSFGKDLERISETNSIDFDPEFLLSTVFGYQDAIIRSDFGIFTIFEPVKRSKLAFWLIYRG